MGDTGPGGGIIVYKDEAGFDNSSGDPTSIGAMCLKVTCHYLEMAPTDLEGTFAWSDAINAAESYSTVATDDWALPSKDALNQICKYAFGDTVNTICNQNRSLSLRLGGFSTDDYWSSSEYDGTYTWSQYFFDGSQNYSIKDPTLYVRPVRAF